MFDTRRVTTPEGSLRAATIGAGPGLLLLHTIRGQLEYHQRVAPALARHHRVHLIDLPGHGRSSKDLSRPYDAARIVAGVTAYIETEGLDDLILVGESIGATTALMLAARTPERLRQVFAVNPYDGGPIIAGPIGSALSQLGRYTALPFALETPWLLRQVCSAAFADPSHLPHDFVELLVRTARSERGSARVMKSMVANQDSWQRPRQADYPWIPTRLSVTLAYGDNDWGPRRNRDENVRLIPPVDGARVLADTGHWSFLDNPAGVLDLVAPGLRP